jgi:hypothetical protein
MIWFSLPRASASAAVDSGESVGAGLLAGFNWELISILV